MKAKLSILALSLVILPGCAALQGQQAADSEAILAEAGFQRVQLESADVKRVPFQLVHDGESYVFVDPKFCNCRYVGGEKEYATLAELRTVRRVEHYRAVGRIGQSSGGADERAWGAWDPKGLDVK